MVESYVIVKAVTVKCEVAMWALDLWDGGLIGA
jgi:hypothetical protein